MEQLYTTKSLAALLQVSPSTVRREMSEGRLNWFKVRGRVRFRESDVQRYLRRFQYRRQPMEKGEVVYVSFKGGNASRRS